MADDDDGMSVHYRFSVALSDDEEGHRNGGLLGRTKSILPERPATPPADAAPLVPCLLHDCAARVPEAELTGHMQSHLGPEPPAYATLLASPSDDDPLVACLLAECDTHVRRSQLKAHMLSHAFAEDGGAPAAATATGTSPSHSELVECPCCCVEYARHELSPLGCDGGHRLCRELCVTRLLAMAERDGTLASCPMCKETLTAADVRRLLGPLHPYAAHYDNMEVRALLTADVRTFLHCPTDGCARVLEVPSHLRDAAVRVVCGRCGTEFCSQCKETPYHYGTSCSEARAVREAWSRFLLEATEMSPEALDEQRDRVRRFEQLRADEELKARECVLCAKCRRPIQRVAGCNQMVCGRNADGGNVQDGCGHRFKWNEARETHPYVAQCPAPPDVSALAALTASDAPHRDCYVCGVCDASPIRGLRLECLNCPGAVSYCRGCLGTVREAHSPSHAFHLRAPPAPAAPAAQPNVAYPSGAEVLERFRNACTQQ